MVYGLLDGYYKVMSNIPKMGRLPSGEHTKSYGKSPFFMGKLHEINGHVQLLFVKLPEGKWLVCLNIQCTPKFQIH